MDEQKHYLLSKTIDINSGNKTGQKIVGRYYTFTQDQLKIGRKLWFKDVDHPLGVHDEGEIVAIRNEVIRKRDYTVISTKIRDYYLTEYQRRN